MEYIQTVIEEPFKYVVDILNNSKSRLFMPVIEGLVENVSTGQKIMHVEKFFVDTGAAINILSPKFINHFNKEHIIDWQPITYGRTTVSLPVYRIHLLIKNHKFENVLAAIDPNLKLYSLLGNEFFQKHIEFISLNCNKKIMKWINIKHKGQIS
jgi:hypothetical protein